MAIPKGRYKVAMGGIINVPTLLLVTSPGNPSVLVSEGSSVGNVGSNKENAGGPPSLPGKCVRWGPRAFSLYEPWNL